MCYLIEEVGVMVKWLNCSTFICARRRTEKKMTKAELIFGQSERLVDPHHRFACPLNLNLLWIKWSNFNNGFAMSATPKKHVASCCIQTFLKI